MNEPTAPRSQRMQQFFHRLRARLLTVIPFASGVAAALAALVIYNLLFPPPAPLSQADVDTSIASAMASATPPPANASLVYQAIMPSLVLIQTERSDNQGHEGRSLGTGVIINDSGAILTSLHVVDTARQIRVTFADGTQSAAEIAAAQPENDIAVLEPAVLPDVLMPATMGNPNAMRIGDEAYAVGNPFGLYGSMSMGVISGFDRSFRNPDTEQELQGLIQMDAAVNPGNSGGPLLNRHGQVVGIVVGIVNPTGQEVFIGIGFAVPIATAAGAAGSPPY